MPHLPVSSSEIEPPSDTDLIKAYLRGDPDALDTLITRYVDRVYVFVRRSIADDKESEDITQEVFVRVWKSIASFDQTKEFKPWIFRIARNACIDFNRKRKTISFSALEIGENETLLEEIRDPELLPPEIFDHEHLGQEVKNALEKLSEQQRQLLFLHYEEDFSLSQIAEMMDESPNTVKSRHLRALSSLRKTLTEKSMHPK
jgi:RNA polymerase sigma-70 factor (ECF subfamily)